MHCPSSNSLLREISLYVSTTRSMVASSWSWPFLLCAVLVDVARARPNTTPTTLCCTLNLHDSYGDGWSGNTFELNNNANTTTASGACSGSLTQMEVCFSYDAAPYMLMLILDGTYVSDISWDMCGGAMSATYSTPVYKVKWDVVLAAWQAGGAGADGVVRTVRPTTTPTTTLLPSFSTLLSPAPSASASAIVVNVKSYSELKRAVQNAPACVDGRRVRIQLLNDVKMGVDDNTTRVPPGSCVEIVGISPADAWPMSTPQPTSATTVTASPTTAVPSLAPTASPCGNGSVALRVAMRDSYGDGWQGARCAWSCLPISFSAVTRSCDSLSHSYLCSRSHIDLCSVQSGAGRGRSL